ncbi:MAG: response regulator [Boseongicola sp.]|nr:response regulator [Boseongicola sp.]
MMFSDFSVLHVEDEILIAIEMASVLADLGFGSVRVAHTLRSAESLVRSERFDVALLDVNLGNGERTTDIGIALRERGTHVIFASGYNKSELSSRLKDFDFIEKPASRDDIVRAVIGVLNAKISA